MSNNIRIFGLNSSTKFAQSICDYLDLELSEHTERYFPDKEPYLKSEVNVRGYDVYVISSLYTDKNESVNDKFIKLLVFVGSLKDASAARVSCVIPYFAFQRQDRKVESRAPITTKYVATLLEAVGVNRVLTMDVHNLSAFQNAFRIQTDNLEAKNLIANHIAGKLKGKGEDVVVLSPDSGGMGRAKRFRDALRKRLNKEIGLAYLNKVRIGSVVQASSIVGDVRDKTVIIMDDLISSGSTLVECKNTIGSSGGELYVACATHGLFVGNINDNLRKLDNIVITDTITPSLDDDNKSRLFTISTSKIFAQAIRRIHDQGGSISDLLK